MSGTSAADLFRTTSRCDLVCPRADRERANQPASQSDRPIIRRSSSRLRHVSPSRSNLNRTAASIALPPAASSLSRLPPSSFRPLRTRSSSSSSSFFSIAAALFLSRTYRAVCLFLSRPLFLSVYLSFSFPPAWNRLGVIARFYVLPCVLRTASGIQDASHQVRGRRRRVRNTTGTTGAGSPSAHPEVPGATRDRGPPTEGIRRP